MTDLRARFASAWRGAGVPGDPTPVVEALLRAYAEPHRAWHTLDHIADGLAELAPLRPHLARPDAVALAWWFHDAVYDPLRSDNEAQSAVWAARALVGAPEGVRALVTTAIGATASHAAHADPDVQVMLDVDLAVLGAAPAAYDRFEHAVRREYAAVPDPMWRAGRAAVLRSFLDDRPCFGSPWFADREARARHNLTRTLAALESP
ncbi:MAG: hypothetical protein H6733_06150 [Alphaproteobacteria bacterium]|nr:hypothetical protein [Alphaproteobacteria bacterium]